MNYTTYIQLILDDGRIRGRETICQLVAIGAAESGLDNMVIGRNDLNGTSVDSDFWASLGLGWLQHDSGWLKRDTEINAVKWSIEEIRNDPQFSIDLLFTRPGFIWQGADHTYITWERWAVYPRKSDQFLTPVKAAYDALML